ncbi:MAG: hypothetical protein QNI90_14130 [Dinoroseobacter sp.]|nr:hypothetical protein [Dinoroseobacter sp.]
MRRSRNALRLSRVTRLGKLLSSLELAGGEVLKRFQVVQSAKDTPQAKANRELAKLKKGTG